MRCHSLKNSEKILGDRRKNTYNIFSAVLFVERAMMGKPDSQQRSLAAEYYVAFILSRLGYDIGITIGRAKIFDMVALGLSGRSIHVQVKSTYSYYDWLIAHDFDSSGNSTVALVRLGKDPTQKPELYLLPGAKANKLRTHKYLNHSPRISRADVRMAFQDHDFVLIKQLLGESEFQGHHTN